MGPTQRELIDAIVADASDRGAWGVYADWLIARADPRGELINLELAIEDGSAGPDAENQVERLNREHALLSPRLHAMAHAWNFTFWRGFIREAKDAGPLVDVPPESEAIEAVEALFADPHAGLLEEISVRHASFARALVACTRPTVKTLTMRNPELGPQLVNLPSLETLDVGSSERELDDIASPRLRWLCGRISSRLGRRLSAALPALESLRSDIGALDRLQHERLRELYCERCPALLGAFELPVLESLSCVVEHADLSALEGVYRRPPPSLTNVSLHVSRPDEAPALVATLADLPILRQLRRVYFSVCTPEILAMIRARAVAFQHLEDLAIGRWGFLAQQSDSDLATALPFTVVSVEVE